MHPEAQIAIEAARIGHETNYGIGLRYAVRRGVAPRLYTLAYALEGKEIQACNP